ncbi:HDOD domain-containing protein [Rhodanobacter sp. AS-Z3]|uniref:EAL and HDOD domain-containing protein n=1 Tax=Rhodanobacter sp. AS-Z3 TaxID=3031330 RepID=UPI00247A03CD|nr:HDOD domain-containing protein [Rhodanobacter sp. AS-Z3]WEN14635.1 HDOD domain-containing protein [Rhodanobacter sp. AS-Z3]
MSTPRNVPSSTSSLHATGGQGSTGTPSSTPLPVLRTPMLDRERNLFAYEVLFHREPGDEESLLRSVLSTITDGSMTRLVRGNRAFLNLPAELLPEDSDVLLHQPRLGLVLQPSVANDPELMKRLQRMAERGCQFVLEAGDTDLEASLSLQGLLQMAQMVRLDASQLEPDVMKARTESLHARGIRVVIGHVDDHETYERCLALPVQAIQGRYLLIPQPVAIPVLTANRMSILRLMGALQEVNPGPVELGAIIRDDAVLSYKLLSCVNSAYFGLPRQLKSVEQAAIFFGVTRMRNWIETMSLCGLDDQPPELLRAAMIRAHMCEKLATGMPDGGPQTAFTVGLFSLLDTLMCAPMEFLLSHLTLAPEVSGALMDRSGPFGALLKEIITWEAGEMTSERAAPQRILRMATVYLSATQWADQVFASAGEKHKTS